MINKPNILVIVGPTSSGKTSLGITLAQKYNGEVISADSRQVYRGLDLGTGKVTETEMQGVPHHLLDIAEPSEIYTVHDFVRDGKAAITDILSRGKLPIIVGGTFLYVDSLLGRISTPEVEPNETLRAILETKSADDLFAELLLKDPVRAEKIDQHNKRRLVRALEIVDALGVVPPSTPHEPYNALTLGISLPKEELVARIHTRLLERFNAGMVAEVEGLVSRGVTYARLAELGLEYRYIAEYLQGKIPYEALVPGIEIKNRQLAKRQMTWLKRDKVNTESREGALGYKSIVWVNPTETKDIEKIVNEFLKQKI